jgi:hypothetical protein
MGKHTVCGGGILTGAISAVFLLWGIFVLPKLSLNIDMFFLPKVNFEQNIQIVKILAICT